MVDIETIYNAGIRVTNPTAVTGLFLGVFPRTVPIWTWCEAS